MIRIGVSLLLLAAAPFAWVAEIPEDKYVIELVPKFGTVTFTHRLHSDWLGGDCVTCHHAYAGGADPIQSCYDCHRAVIHREAAVVRAAPEVSGESSDEPPKAEHAFHTLCIECHEAERVQGRPTGPTDSCRDCHV
jgi:hypothetical protein